MPTSTPSTSESAARLAHLAADVVLHHRLAQALPWRATQALLSVARRDPGSDPEDARKLVQAALTAIITAEVIALREGRP